MQDLRIPRSELLAYDRHITRKRSKQFGLPIVLCEAIPRLISGGVCRLKFRVVFDFCDDFICS
jgi:hypothetical protein